MYDSGMMTKTIAATVGLNRNRVHELLRAAFEQAGSTFPQGKNPKADRALNKQAALQHESLSEMVKVFADQGMPLQQIAEQLKTHRDAVTRTLRYWYESRGEQYLDGRARRKQLRLLREGVAS